MPKKTKPTKPKTIQNPLDQVFEDWYTQFGVRFYTPEGHKEYLRYAYVHGVIAGIKIVQDKLPQEG